MNDIHPIDRVVPIDDGYEQSVRTPPIIYYLRRARFSHERFSSFFFFSFFYSLRPTNIYLLYASVMLAKKKKRMKKIIITTRPRRARKRKKKKTIFIKPRKTNISTRRRPRADCDFRSHVKRKKKKKSSFVFRTRRPGTFAFDRIPVLIPPPSSRGRNYVQITLFFFYYSFSGSMYTYRQVTSAENDTRHYRKNTTYLLEFLSALNVGNRNDKQFLYLFLMTY